MPLNILFQNPECQSPHGDPSDFTAQSLVWNPVILCAIIMRIYRDTKRLQKNLKKFSKMPLINFSQNPEGQSPSHDGSNFTGQSLNGRTVIKALGTEKRQRVYPGFLNVFQKI